MRSYAQKAISMVDGVSEQEFLANDEKQLAVTRAVEVIGEAAKSVPDDVRSLAPDIPWRQIVGTRDKLVHQYWGTKLDIVWQVTQEDLPKLVEQIDILIEKLESG